MDATRVLVTGNHAAGVFVNNEDTAVTLTDVVVRDSAVGPNHADGLDVRRGALLEAQRVSIFGNESVGVEVVDEGTQVILTDVVVRDIRLDDTTGDAGRAVEVVDGGELTATRSLFASSIEVAIHVANPGSLATLVDVAVTDVTSRRGDGAGGRGINVQLKARLTGSRVAVMRCREFGVLSTQGAVVELEDVLVSGVEYSACGLTTCTSQPFGHGAAAISGSVRLSRFELRDVASCGLLLAPISRSGAPASIDLDQGRVTGAVIGACIQIADYEIGRLTQGVEYIGNQTNLDSTTLPVPDAVDSVLIP